MGLGNILLLSQVTAYLIAFILSFFIFIPIGVCRNNFDGNCLLFATGTWAAKGGQDVQLTHVDWETPSPCNFAVFTGVLVLMVSAGYVVWYSILLFREIDSSWLDAFLNGGLNLFLMIFSFATALTVSLGFRDWCSLVTDPKGNFQSCEDADYVSFGDAVGIKTEHFFLQFQMVQFGSWCVWICMLILFILSVIKLFRYHSQEAFLTSMTRERQRLIQRVQNRSSYSAAVPT